MSVRGSGRRTPLPGGSLRSAAVRLCWLLGLLLACSPSLPGVSAELLSEGVQDVGEDGKSESVQPRDRGRSRVDVPQPERGKSPRPRRRDESARRDRAFLPIGNPSAGFVLPLRL